MNLSTDDQLLYNWLSGVEPQNFEIRIDPQESHIMVRCADVYTAEKLWRSRYYITPPNELEVYVGQRIYDSTTNNENELNCFPNLSMTQQTQINTQSSWVLQNQNIFESIAGTRFVYSADPDTGYKLKAVRPDVSEKRLNKPISDIFGKPLRTIDEAIALPRERCIEQAIASASAQDYYYEHIWQGAIWRFKGRAIPLPSHNEVLVIIQDADGFGWQREYFLNLAP